MKDHKTLVCTLQNPVYKCAESRRLRKRPQFRANNMVWKYALDGLIRISQDLPGWNDLFYLIAWTETAVPCADHRILVVWYNPSFYSFCGYSIQV